MTHDALRPYCGECKFALKRTLRIPSAAVAKVGSVLCETY